MASSTGGRRPPRPMASESRGPDRQPRTRPPPGSSPRPRGRPAAHVGDSTTPTGRACSRHRHSVRRYCLIITYLRRARLRGNHDQALEIVDGLGAADDDRLPGWSGPGATRSHSPRARSALSAASPLPAEDRYDVFAGLSQGGDQLGGEACRCPPAPTPACWEPAGKLSRAAAGSRGPRPDR